MENGDTQESTCTVFPGVTVCRDMAVTAGEGPGCYTCGEMSPGSVRNGCKVVLTVTLLNRDDICGKTPAPSKGDSRVEHVNTVKHL